MQRRLGEITGLTEIGRKSESYKSNIKEGEKKR